MSSPTTIQGNLHVMGQLSAQSIGGLNGSLTDGDLADDADLDPAKMRHRIYAVAVQETPAAATIPLHLVHGTTAEIVSVEAVMVDPPSGGDTTLSVDVQAGNEATAYATVLTAALQFSASQADREVVGGTLASTDLDAADSLVAVITLGGSTGSYGSGLLVTVILDEKPV